MHDNKGEKMLFFLHQKSARKRKGNKENKERASKFSKHQNKDKSSSFPNEKGKNTLLPWKKKGKKKKYKSYLPKDKH